MTARRAWCRQTLAHLSSAPLLASSGVPTLLSLSLGNSDVFFRFIDMRAIFRMIDRVLRRPIEIAEAKRTFVVNWPAGPDVNSS